MSRVEFCVKQEFGSSIRASGVMVVGGWGVGWHSYHTNYSTFSAGMLLSAVALMVPLFPNHPLFRSFSSSYPTILYVGSALVICRTSNPLA